jgi:hypothetical protein
MKLNHNCIRDLLLFIEDNLTYGNYISINDLQINKYSTTQIIYSADKLLEAGYLIGNKNNPYSNKVPSIDIHSISWYGHQFLDNIRDDKVWKNTRSILSKFSSVSISIVNNVASQVISNLVKSQIGL